MLFMLCLYCSLRNKHSELKKMEETYLDTKETLANKTYENEVALTKHIFQDVKNDLVRIKFNSI